MNKRESCSKVGRSGDANISRDATQVFWSREKRQEETDRVVISCSAGHYCSNEWSWT